jgi:hypothetical protein
MGDRRKVAADRAASRLAAWTWQIVASEAPLRNAIGEVISASCAAEVSYGEPRFYPVSRSALALEARRPAAWCVLGNPSRPLGSEIVVEIPAPLALTIVDRTLGSAAVHSFPNRPLRPIELGVIGFSVCEGLSTSGHFPHLRVLNVLGERKALPGLWRETESIHAVHQRVTLFGSDFHLRFFFPMTALEPSALGCCTEVGFAHIVTTGLESLAVGWGLRLDQGPVRSPDGSWVGRLAFSPPRECGRVWYAAYREEHWSLDPTPVERPAATSSGARLIRACILGEWPHHLDADAGPALPERITLYDENASIGEGRLVWHQGAAAVQITERRNQRAPDPIGSLA